MSSVEIGAITHLMMNQFDRPEAPLTVEPVTILGDSAIAGWRQGDMAGRALLRRSADGWAIVLCAGEEVLDPAFLAHNGIGMEAAHGLTDAARSAESGLGAELIARLDAFDGVVMIASGDAHDHGQHGDGHSSAAGH
ncbi:copper uptake system-associated protein [Pararhodobacter sp. CCB-MM2]|uniref:copper uptake system-associated protein n=1 Tax=Pararhodobacter sp. CCB-MM2 TaxID=1786003 RepID=UPI0013149DFE|nr:copper uptake system-associated protein [Pararhodobacter sp. CCB-MM2]